MPMLLNSLAMPRRAARWMLPESSRPMDRHARKQVLLARIAFERVEMQRDVARVRQAAHLPQLLRSVVGGGLGASLLGAGTAGQGGWLSLAMSLLGRYRVAAGLLASAAPLLGGRRGWRRVVRVGVFAAAAWLGWRVVRQRGNPTD
jgi:hypothetical protein